MQDINGWRTLQEKLGKKCLLIAEKVLRKGLPLKSPPTSLSCGSSAENTEDHLENDETPDEVPTQGESNEGRNESATLEDKEPGVEYLSCAGVQLETTVWSTMQKAAALKG